MIPAACQRVCVEGRPGVYFVLSVNREYRYAEWVEVDSATLVDAIQRMENACFPVQSGIESTCRSVLVGIRSIMNLRLNPALWV